MQWYAEFPRLKEVLTGYLRKRGKSLWEAQDLMQEAFLKVERYCQESGNEIDCPEAFLKRTVMNLVVDEHKDELAYVRGRVSLDKVSIQDPTARPDDKIVYHQCLEHAEKVLKQHLGPKITDMFFLDRVAGWKQHDIAAKYQCSVSLVRHNIARAAAVLTKERLYGRM